MHIKSATAARPRNYRINRAYPQAPVFMSTFMPLTVDAQLLQSHVSKPYGLHQTPTTAMMQVHAQARLLPGCCLHSTVVVLWCTSSGNTAGQHSELVACCNGGSAHFILFVTCDAYIPRWKRTVCIICAVCVLHAHATNSEHATCCPRYIGAERPAVALKNHLNHLKESIKTPC